MLKKRVQGDRATSALVLADCGDHVLRHLGNTSPGVSALPGRAIAREGDSGGALCIVISEGVADVVIGGRAVATLGRGDLFVEVPFTNGRPRTAGVIARTRARLFALDAQGLIELLALFPALSRHFLRHLATGVRDGEEIVHVVAAMPIAAE